MGNTDKFDVIADNYDSPERMRIAEISSDALREYLDDSKNKSAIDFGCGTGLVGISLINEFRHMLFLDTSQNMISVVDRKINEAGIVNANSLCFDFETSDSETVNADYIFMAQVLLHIRDYKSVLQKLHG
ncbi:MAG: methyltransferase, partial [Proteocatella sp.]|nr:methyltransferase [Proteocatella sp.]